MTISLFYSVVFGVVLSWSMDSVDGTEVVNCLNSFFGDTGNDDKFAVKLSDNDTFPCTLEANSTTLLEIKFVPKTDVGSLKNSAYLRLVGIPFPVLGVDDTSSCGSLYHSDGESKAGCPLKAGTEYVYRNNIEVVPFYPQTKSWLHWALEDVDSGENIVCFDVRCRILRP